MLRHLFICGLGLSVFVGLLTLPGLGWAHPDEEVRKELKELREIVQKQQVRIDELERKVATVRAEPVEAQTAVSQDVRPSTSSGRTGLPGHDLEIRDGAASSSRSQIGAILPEIGVVGDIVATASESKGDTEGNNRVSAREIELVFGNYVDPYSRYDATLSFSDFEAVGVEEAYLTRWGLPWDLKGRIGRFFPRVGKAAAMHRDSLSTVDEPLVIRRYFGSEGFNRTGVDFTKPVEGPWGLVLEPSIGILEGGVGEGGTLFGSTRRRPTFYEHLKTFRDLSDLSSLELGLTHLVGSKDADAAMEVNAFGVDATYLYHLTPINPLKIQGEFYLQNRKEAFSINSTTGVTTRFDRHPWGTYLLADYRFAPRWSAGVRADHVRLVDAANPRHADQGLSAFLTFYQSEFARWRLQVRHEEKGSATEKTEDAAFLQGTFAIGTHKHQLQ
ncbi:MAG: hypothetical protein HY211_07545 [Candidatus Omnitrophica bacterium]|nr:hypothetical protein [Candidatus Omnitrophota bacterium]